VLKNAPHKQAAIKFLEYLTSDQAQSYLANGNNEWPVVPTVKVSNPALDALGTFKADTVNVGSLGQHQPSGRQAAGLTWRR
jgi:iron(III) transport system substrate-binding protein